MTGAIWRKPFISKAAIFSFVLFGFLLAAGVRDLSAQAFSEGFDTVNSNMPEPIPNWVAINRSSPVGASLWFQGNPAVFSSHDGGADSYIGANFQATTGDNTISAWLLTPQTTLNNGDVISFWTRTVADSIYPDRLQLRLSTNGASTDVGTTNVSVGDFTTLLLEINPDLETGGYPEDWTLETVTLAGLPAGGTSGRIAFRYFVTDGGPDGANSDYIGIDTFSFGAAAVPAAHQESDYDGDGRTDLSVVRNTGGGGSGQVTWYNRRSSDGNMYAAPWGIASDTFVPGDYDNDNKSDIAVWRQGAPGVAAYYIFYTGTSTMGTFQFGQTGDDPAVQADYDGDGKTDIAVYRAGAAAGEQSYFFYRGSLNNPSGNITYVPWGVHGDFPAPGDYDGDGRGDFVVQRDDGGGQARFYRLFANGTTDSFVFGNPTDFVVPGDYDGDGRTDVAVLRGNGGLLYWYILQSSNGATTGGPFGNSATDFSCQGDYDGDGKTDVAVWRPNADPTMTYFYWLGSTSGFSAGEWGQNGDYPVANWNTH